MGGFASLIGGLGEGAQQYGAQVRNLNLQKWGMVQNHLAEMIAQARQSATTPERQVELDQLRSKVLGMRPGEDPTKVLTDVQEHLSLHPVAAAALAGPQQKEPPPGPTPIGQPAGTGGNALANMIGGGQLSGKLEGAAPPATAPPDAQPQTSPVSPAAQGGGAQPSPQPSSTPAITPIPQAGPDMGGDVRSRYSSALASGTMPPALATAAQPFLTNTAELDRTRMLDQYLLRELGPERLAFIKQNTPGWDSMPAPLQAAHAESLIGTTPVNYPMGMATLARVHEQPVDASNMSPQDKAAWGLPPNASGRWSAEVDGMGNPTGRNAVQGWAGVRTVATPGGVGMIDVNTPDQSPTTIPGAIPGSYNTPHTETLPSGKTAFQSPAAAGAGVAPVPTGGVSAPMMPHTTNSERLVRTVGPNGEITQEVQPFSSVRSVGSAASPSHIQSVGGSAGRSFPVPFTPQQELTNEQQLNTLTRAESVMQRIRNNSHLLDSMIESGKLHLEAGDGGVLRAVIAKNLPMTAAESQFAADVTTMAEDINLLRKPLGGAGFRSEEAWAALQGLRGSLLQHPEVSRRVMDNTLQAFEALRQPLAKRAPSGQGGPKVGDIEDGYKYKGGDPSKPDSWEKVK